MVNKKALLYRYMDTCTVFHESDSSSLSPVKITGCGQIYQNFCRSPVILAGNIILCGNFSNHAKGEIMKTPAKPLKKIKSGVFSRGLALARVSVSSGVKVASHAMGNLFTDPASQPERYKELLMSQVGMLSRELGELKGSLMKVGQMLSMYGEHFLPPEANQLLKSLQSQSPPLEWKAIHKVILRQLPPERLNELDIEPVALASASLGQVHRARRKSDGREFAMKIQYPGVDQAIEGDLKALKSLLMVSKLIPKGPKFDELFKEVRTMLHQEVNYSKEFETTQEFRNHLAKDPRFIVPEPIAEYSTPRILTTSLEMGVPVDSPEVLALPLERRNAIGAAILDLYFMELFEFAAVQTDPHFGNYRIRLGTGSESDQIVLLDFGAVRKLSKKFMEPYLEMVRGAHTRNTKRIIQGGIGLGYLQEDDPDELKQLFVELCQLITEPFFPTKNSPYFDNTGAYCWETSELPLRVAKKGGQMAVRFKLRSPPREVVFLDRKLGGMFIFMSVLKIRIKSEEVFRKYLI